MAIASPANSTINAMLNEIVHNYYPDIEECQAKISIMMIDPNPGKLDKPALLDNGLPIDGKIRIVSYIDRVSGLPDVIIKLDSPNWYNINNTEQYSLLDRMLYRIDIQRDKSGAIKIDDRGRPTIKLKPYDYRVQGYNLTTHRHGRNGVDAKAIEDLSLHYQTLIPII